MKRKKLIIFFSALILIIVLCLVINHFVNHTGEFVDEKLYWKGSYYHEINAYSYEYKESGKIGKTKNHRFNISAIEGDYDHIFMSLWDLTDNYLYVKDDYEIPVSGKITTVYIAGSIYKFEDKEFCDAINGLLFSGFINDKREKFILKTDNILHFTDDITLAFNGCPVGSKFAGYIGMINNKWVYIPKTKIETDENGFDKPTNFTCYIIDNYKNLSVIKKYVEPK